MNIQARLLKFVTRSNWVLLFIISAIGLFVSSPDVARGMIFGGLIVTINFHLLYRTLRRGFTPPNLASHNVILAKYYLRFIVTGMVIFVLIFSRLVNPVGLVIGLSIVVASVLLATVIEIRALFVKETL